MNFFKRFFTLSLIPLLALLGAGAIGFFVNPITGPVIAAIIILAVSGILGTISQFCNYQGLPYFSTHNILLKKIFEEVNFLDGEYKDSNGDTIDEYSWIWHSPTTKRSVVIERTLHLQSPISEYSVKINGNKLDLSSFDKKMIRKFFNKKNKFGNEDKEIFKLNATLSEMIDEANEITEKELRAKLAKMEDFREKRLTEMQEMIRKDPPKVNA